VGPLNSIQRRIDDMRFRGFGGSAIRMHRSINQLSLSKANLLAALVLPLLFTVLTALLLSPILHLWRALFAFWQPRLAESGAVAIHEVDLGRYAMSLPYPSFPSAYPGQHAWWLTFAVCAVIFVATFFISPKRFLPLNYIIRACLLVQATALLYFHFLPGQFPYDADAYLVNALIMALIFLFLMPWGLGLTYYVFNFSLARKVGLTLLLLGYFVIAFPMQYLLHAYVLHQMSLLFMPLLYLVFGTFLDVMMFVALYSWGMSWKRSDI